MPDKIPTPTPGNPAIPPPGKPLLKSFPTPELKDRILQVRIDSRKGAFDVPEKGSRYTGPNENEFEDFLFATCIPDPSSPVGWWLQFYVNERENQDDYNFSIEYPWVDKTYPRVTRTYVILREKLEQPDPDETDPTHDALSLIDFKVTRAEDPVIDALFVAVTKVYERVPAPTEYSYDRADAVLPYNMRVRVPAFQVTSVDEEAAQVPILVNEEDWNAKDTTNTFNRRTRVVEKRVIPNGSVTLDKGEEVTRDQQLARRTETWAIGAQVITPRATTVRATVEDVGNNTSVRDELSVERVFPATEIKVEIPDLIPTPFRALVPTRTVGITSEGQVTDPVLGVGELERIHRAETDLIKREIVTGRDITQLPKTLHDFDLDGIPSHGSVFGGIYDSARTLADTPQTVDEGFFVKSSSVTNLGNGLTLKETKQLSGVQGAHLLLTDPGHNFVCDPEVVFSAGDIGTGAAATPMMSTIPVGGGGLPGEDPGGTFVCALEDFGDTHGALYLIGARYNGGQWTNPFTHGNINITYHNSPSYPLGLDSLASLVGREPQGFVTIQPTQRDGSDFLAIDFGIGKSMAVDTITIKTNTLVDGQDPKIWIQASNDGVSWHTLSNVTLLPVTPDTWRAFSISDHTPYRYFKFFGLGTEIPGLIPPTLPLFGFQEVEFYGTLTIVPGVNCEYLFDGDARGAFFYLGKRGGHGTWRNPHTYGDITCSADDLSEGTLDQLVDRQPSNIVLGPSANKAYYFDLGPQTGRKLICNKLSYRQRTQFGSSTQSFTLQGRNDVNNPSDWHVLATCNPAGTPDTWTTIPVAGTIGYRQFRIISPQGNFTIGEFELYGALTIGTDPVAVPTYSVTSVAMTNGGLHYVGEVEVRFVGGGGTGASGTAVVENGSVTGVTMHSPGGGYTGGGPGIYFFVAGGGKDAAATGNIVGDSVDSYTVDNPGVEYPVAPDVEIVGDGTGATAIAIVNAAGQVTSVARVMGGTGYTIASVLFRSAGGPVAVAKVGFGIVSVTKTNSGLNYPAPPAVEIQGDGTGCQLHAVLGYPIVSVTMNNRGSGYTGTPTATASTSGQGGGTSPPTLTAVRGFAVASVNFSPNSTLYLNEPEVIVSGGGTFGQGAQFRAWVGRPVQSLQLGSQGINYSSDVSISLVDTGGTGTGATGSVTRSFAIDIIGGGSGGTGYNTATVTIDAPTGFNGRTGTAHAVIAAGVITSIVVDDPGFGYLVTPGVAVTGDGTGATGWVATLFTTGAINSVSLGATGAGYSENPVVLIAATTGSGASIVSSLNTSALGTIVKVTILNGGFGYTSPPTLGITGNVGNAVAVLSTSGQIVAVTVSPTAGSGSGWIQNAAIIFTGGGGVGASATAHIGTVGNVKSFVVDSPGQDYTTAIVVVSSGTAAGTVVFGAGKIKTLTLIDPGPDYEVAPLVSFFGCGGTGAAALYILATGYPELTDYITDPVEKIVVQVLKKIVRPDAVRPAGYVDQYALDRYRSIQIISSVLSLPPAETFFMTHVLNLPDTLVSIGSTYTRDTSQAVGIDTAFGSTSVHSSVSGKLFARVLHGYKGPAKATVIRKFLPAPPVSTQTPNPLIITPSTGTVYIISRGETRKTSLGVRGGFGYIEDSVDEHESIDALDISGVLTGGVISSQSSGVQTVNAIALAAAALGRAQRAGFFFDGFRTNIAQNIVTAEANLIADISPSCPQFIAPNTTFLLSATVEKWRLGIYVQTLTYVTVPCPGPSHADLYSGLTVCDPCGGAITGGST